MLLLNPGPVTLSERVRRSLLQPDPCHRESEFFDLQDEARGIPGLAFVMCRRAALARTLFRISTMGEVRAPDIERLLRCCASLF